MKCELSDWVGPLAAKQVKPAHELKAAAETEDFETQEALVEAIELGNTAADMANPEDSERCVAVVRWEGDTDEDCFALMRVTQRMHTLTTDTQGGLGNDMPASSVVVGGRMYVRATDSSGTFEDDDGTYYAQEPEVAEMLVYCHLVLAAVPELELWQRPSRPAEIRRDAPAPAGTDAAKAWDRNGLKRVRRPNPWLAEEKHEPREGTRVLPTQQREEFLKVASV